MRACLFFAMTLAAHTVWRLDDARFAAELHDLLRPFSHLCSVPGTGPLPFFGSVALHAAGAAIAADRIDDALDLLDEADEAHQRLGITPWLLRSLLTRATARQRRGRRDDPAAAAALLRRVSGEARALGARAIATHAEELLVSLPAAG